MKKLLIFCINQLAKITWYNWIEFTNFGRKYLITEQEKQQLRQLLAKDYYIILTRSNGHLSTYLVATATFLVMKKWGFWGHALMNVEDTVIIDSDFQLQEATAIGVERNSFDKVFSCDAVALLKPKHMTLDDWTTVMDAAKQQLGKKYDTLGDLSDDTKVNCVEMVRTALKKGVKDYDSKFAFFEGMIKGAGNLPPEMFYDCPDFEVVWEVRY